MKIKTTEVLKKSGWEFIPDMGLFENENLKLPNGSVVVLSLNMMELFSKLTPEESLFLESALGVANTIFFRNYWWHRDMFEDFELKCEHSWIDVGFVFPKLICKQCDQEKENE